MKYFTTQKPKTNYTPIRLFSLWISVVWFFSPIIYFFSIVTTTDWKQKRFLIYFPLLKFSSIEIFFACFVFAAVCVCRVRVPAFKKQFATESVQPSVHL